MEIPIYIYRRASYDATSKKLSSYVDVYRTEDKARQHYNEDAAFYKTYHAVVRFEEIDYGSHFVAYLEDGTIVTSRWHKDAI